MWIPRYTVAIFLKMSQAILIVFQQFVDAASLDKPTDCNCMHIKGPKVSISLFWQVAKCYLRN
jgi:hypothetical protein